MKIKVLKPFRDKQTEETYKVDQIVEITEERYAEIKRTASFNVQFEVVGKIDLDNLTKKEIVQHAKEKEIELDMEMTKKDMIKKIDE